MQLSPSSHLGPSILSTPFSNTLTVCSALRVSNQTSHPYKTRNIIVLYILIYTVWIGGRKREDPELNSSKYALSLTLCECNFYLLLSLPNTWTLPHFQRICMDTFILWENMTVPLWTQKHSAVSIFRVEWMGPEVDTDIGQEVEVGVQSHPDQ
jgi:hypothetical protein